MPYRYHIVLYSLKLRLQFFYLRELKRAGKIRKLTLYAFNKRKYYIILYIEVLALIVSEI